MSKDNPASSQPDLTRPLAYQAEKVVRIARTMLEHIVSDEVKLQKILKVIEDAFMAGAFYSLDISLYGLDFDDGDDPIVDYAISALVEESQEASQIVQTLTEQRHDEPDDDDDDGGGGGSLTVPPHRGALH